MVPDSCEFEIERRLLPGEDGRQAVRDCEQWVRECVGSEIRLLMKEPYLLDPALDTPPEAALVRAVGQAHMSEFGSVSAIEGAHYGTDGSKLAHAGIETVVCGPGDIAQAHTGDEFIEIEQVERAVRLYARLLEQWPLTSLASEAK
jgi:acetylornithine deacetylase